VLLGCSVQAWRQDLTSREASTSIDKKFGPTTAEQSKSCADSVLEPSSFGVIAT
jgi:hypothetical protein